MLPGLRGAEAPGCGRAPIGAGRGTTAGGSPVRRRAGPRYDDGRVPGTTGRPGTAPRATAAPRCPAARPVRFPSVRGPRGPSSRHRRRPPVSPVRHFRANSRSGQGSCTRQPGRPAPVRQGRRVRGTARGRRSGASVRAAGWCGAGGAPGDRRARHVREQEPRRAERRPGRPRPHVSGHRRVLGSVGGRRRVPGTGRGTAQERRGGVRGAGELVAPGARRRAPHPPLPVLRRLRVPRRRGPRADRHRGDRPRATASTSARRTSSAGSASRTTCTSRRRPASARRSRSPRVPPYRPGSDRYGAPPRRGGDGERPGATGAPHPRRCPRSFRAASFRVSRRA